MLDDAHGLHADSTDAGEQVNDLFFIVAEAVGVELVADGGVFGGALFVAVQHPFQGGTVAQLVVPRLSRDAAEGGYGINFDAPVPDPPVPDPPVPGSPAPVSPAFLIALRRAL